MKEEHKYLISVLKAEIQKAFDNFDVNVENGQHSVPIQTLDYWVMKLEQILRETKDHTLNGRVIRMSDIPDGRMMIKVHDCHPRLNGLWVEVTGKEFRPGGKKE